MWLAIKDLSDFVPKLIETGAALEDTGGLGRTALMWAAEMGHMSTTKTLIEQGANLKARNKSGHTPIWYAEWQEDLDMVSYFKEAGGI